MEDFFEQGDGFDGSSISGFGQIEESDMVAVPDPTTFGIIPWRAAEHSIGRVLCDIYTPNDDRYDGDPRGILQKTINKLGDDGYTFMCAPELEFFWLKADGEGTPTEVDFRGYFDNDPTDENQLMRWEVSRYSDAFGIEIEAMHHEVAKSQHEVDIKYNVAGLMADWTVTVKDIVRVVGARYNYIGTFMPKPFHGVNGSGMHVHQSLWKDGQNTFFDDSDPNKISDTLRNFIAGQLSHAQEFCAVTSSWPNSYKRLVPGYEAPNYIAWGFKNRSMLIRVPNFFRKPKSARCEIRSPDPAGNIYLQLAVLMAAGYDGVKQQLQAPDPVELNIFHVEKSEQERLGVTNLPRDLGDALDSMSKSSFMKEVLGETAFNNYIELKAQEFQIYSAQVSPWELKRYTAAF